MRDSRRMRLVLALLVLTAFTLITLDYRSNGGGPLRAIASTVFGPVENAVSAVTRPVGSWFSGVVHGGRYKSQNGKLRTENQQLREQLRLTDSDRARLAEFEKLYGFNARSQFRLVAAHVTAVGAGLGFEWTATIDAGTDDGVHTGQTVLDGDGLVGRVKRADATSSTVLLARDPDFSVGARLAGSQEIGHVDGRGRLPMTFTLLPLTSQPVLREGQRLVTFGSIGDSPFVPEVPIGRVTQLESTPGALTRTAVVTPYVDFSALDVVGVVVGVPRTIKRDSLLPPSPSPTPAAKPSASRRSPAAGSSPTP